MRLPADDLEAVGARLAPLWPDLEGSRILLTGGTGFYGCWLLETLLWADDALGLGVRVDVPTRHPAAFRAKAPHLASHPAVRLIEADVRRLPHQMGAPYTHVIHAATDSSATLDDAGRVTMFDTILDGTRAALAAAAPGQARVLLTSSGMVYGLQPPSLSHVSEDFQGGPDPLAPAAAYGEGKRAAETLGGLLGAASGAHVVVSRGFAFVGPHLPLDRAFAIGNFMRDGLAGRPITVGGDGTPVRSYMYASDLAVWLWTLLLRGEAGRAYNTGAERAVTIAETAALVGRATNQPVSIARAAVPGAIAHRYVPSTARAASDLRLSCTVNLEEAITKTLAWHRSKLTS